MKSFRKVVIASLLAAGAAWAPSAAWANSELVPGSRLVAPYWDISGDRTTLMFLTNASTRANLQKTATSALLNGTCNLGAATPGTICAVHLEFYDKTCTNVDLTIDLSKQDIAQLDLKLDSDLGNVRGLPSGLGWMDADIRSAITGSGHTNTSVQANVLMGNVVITDSGSDFAVAFPMASAIGSSNSGIGGDIVSRTSTGNANAWNGGYESFPSRVFVPMFFAEGSNHGLNFSSTLAIAGPAQAINGGEAPGQVLGSVSGSGTFTAPSPLIDADADVLDACENPQSDRLKHHYVFGTLDALFFATVTAPYNTTCNFPAADVNRTGTTAANAFSGGWIDIRNNRAFSDQTTGGTVGADHLPRGLVGVLVQESQTSAGATKTGDAVRLWGDCAAGATLGDGRALGCRHSFSLVGTVSHDDLRP